MKIFINDIPVSLIKAGRKKRKGHFSTVIDAGTRKIKTGKLIDDVLIVNASYKTIEKMLQLMTDKKLRHMDSVTFASRDKNTLVAYIRKKFSIVNAAGGVVDKGGLTLLIFRHGKWDLPKGKSDKGETMKACALREVEEETGVKCELLNKVCHTWHTYIRNKKYVLKKTNWYAMNCLDDSAMNPQTEEGIDETKWMNLTQTREALHNSYRTIRYVISVYNKQLKSSAAHKAG